jgi:sugar phosphate isomerase/epimerase
MDKLFKEEFVKISMKIIHIWSKLQAEKANVKFYLDKNDYSNVLKSAEKLNRYSITYDSLQAYLNQLLQFAKRLNISLSIDVDELTNFDDLLK